MNEIPSYWLALSSIFFLVGIVLFSALTYVLFRMLKTLEEIKPRIDSLGTKVEALVVKVDKLTDRMDETLATVHQSVDGVSGTARGILGAVEKIIAPAGKLDMVGPIISGALTAFKLFQTVKHARAAAHPKTSDKKALPAAKSHPKP